MIGITSVELVFIIASLVGMICHWLKQYLTDETNASITEWFGTSNIKATILSLGSCIFVVIGALSMGMIPPATTFWTAVYIGLTTGFSIDASMNADKRRKTPLTAIAQKTLAKVRRETTLK